VYDELAIIVRGDLNGDGYVTVTDYVKMKNHFLGKAEFNYLENCAAEVSGDEYVTVTDYVKMKNYFLGKITTLN
ncbi:MAG: dockerin type I repeat-containing protein, partial [Clostridia bacterium]|nr:dockerin type I repeat-containing protein [Clostridia bacterium]